MEKNKYTTGFKIPEGYFEEFDARMRDKLKEEQLPKDAGFAVPEGYFDAIEEKILQAETTYKWQPFRNAQNYGAKPHPKKFVYSLVGIAAVLAIILSLFPFGTGAAISFEDLNETAVSEYIQDGALNLTADDLAMYLQDEYFDLLVIPSEEISEENLSDYLLNNLDNNTLLFE
jgi:hypothetical protein